MDISRTIKTKSPKKLIEIKKNIPSYNTILYKPDLIKIEIVYRCLNLKW